MRSIGDILAGLRRDLSLSAMPPHLAEGIRIQQLNRLAFFNRVMPLTGINTLLFVVWACWDEGRPNLLLFTLVGIVSLYILLLARASRWQREA